MWGEGGEIIIYSLQNSRLPYVHQYQPYAYVPCFAGIIISIYHGRIVQVRKP
jgi:hypothetical protein